MLQNEALAKNADRRLIVSMTSYPARIHAVARVLDTIYAQTHPADEIVLWLAEEQFPEKEAELPAELLDLVQDNRLTIGWCSNLKPHTKYFYAMQTYRDALIVTVDDDQLYPETLLENLYQSYLRHPNAVSAARVHLMILSEQGKVLPYGDWIKETDFCLDQPSMQLFATGVGGVLYPPELFRQELFNKEAILETCLRADDLWLKAVELISDIPVVVAQPFTDLRHVPGTQEEGLYHQNEYAGENDEQWQKISQWMDDHVEPGILTRKLTQSNIGVPILGIEALCAHMSAERAKHRKKMWEANAKLKKTYAEKSEINAKLKQTYAEKSEVNAKLKNAYAEKSEINAKLKQAYAEKSEINQKLQKSTELIRQQASQIELLNKQLQEEIARKTLRGKLNRILNFAKRLLGRSST